MSKRGPTAIDAHVGARIRERRVMLGLSQETLAAALGVSFQQVQKYENGRNRIGAGRLYQIASALSVPVGYFYEDAPESDVAPLAAGSAPQRISAESLRLGADFDRIRDPSTRRQLSELVRALAAGG